MTKQRRILRAIAPIAIIVIAVSMAGTAVAGPGKEKKKAAKALFQSHMKLGEYYMLAGQYQKAMGHFEAIIDFEIALPEEADPGAEVFAEGGDKARRGGKKKLVRAKLRAHMGAAIAAHRLGEQTKAEAFAEAGVELAQKHGVRRGVKMFERFLDDPDEVAERAGPSVKALEARIKRANEALAP